MTFNEEIEAALDAFWHAAYEQGRDQRNHDDEEGTAQKAEDDLRKAIAALAASPAGVGVETYTDLERKYLPIAKKIVNGRSLSHPYPGDDTTRIVGFRVPADVAGLSEALFALDTIRLAGIAKYSQEEARELGRIVAGLSKGLRARAAAAEALLKEAQRERYEAVARANQVGEHAAKLMAAFGGAYVSALKEKP